MTFSVENVGFDRGNAALLDDVSVQFERGEVSAIVGPNGAGKSTLLRIMAGLAQQDRGTVLLEDGPVSGLSARDRARKIGYLPQSPEVHWDLDVRECVALGRYPWSGGAIGPTDKEAIDTAMSATDTTGFATRRISTLSGGERARVLLARVLAGEPDWIIADEPLASLDPAHQRETLTLLKNAAAAGTGVILVLHDLAMALASADRVIVMDDGHLLAAGSTDLLLDQDLMKRVFGIGTMLVENRRGDRTLALFSPDSET